MPHSVKEAKDNLSELIRLAENGKPQVIKRHEKEVAVIVSVNDWNRSNGKHRSLFEMFRSSPLVGVELDLERPKDMPRDIDLGK